MRVPSLILVAAVLLSAPARGADVSLDQLAARLVGNFSNEAQARVDFNFRNVVLHVGRIWPERTDGPWLYLEQALADAPGEPYRQQVYQLAAAADGSIEVRVFKVPDPVAVTGAWREPLRFATVTPADLRVCPGCALRLKHEPNGALHGETEGKGCASEIHNAAYATTELTVGENSLTIWDRGFNANGLQIWGPPNTGFEFKRIE